jgi:hypothetical protein
MERAEITRVHVMLTERRGRRTREEETRGKDCESESDR